MKVGKLWGFIDKTGNLAIMPRFPRAENFQEGLAQVEINGRYGFIDRTGCVVIEPAFDANLLEWFSEGLFVIKAGEKYGYIDRTGRTIVAPRYWFAYEFQQGVASVQADDGRWILIHRTGKTISKGSFDNIDEFREGMARVRIEREYGFVDSKGTLCVPVRFSAALPFSGGLAAVYVGGYHDRLHTEEHRMPFDPASPWFWYLKLPFTKEKVHRMIGGKGWGYVNRRGEMIIPPAFDYAGSFTCGLAEVKKGNRYGYIDRSGKFVWETHDRRCGGPTDPDGAE